MYHSYEKRAQESSRLAGHNVIKKKKKPFSEKNISF
jgi:hypothetical protein